jgi:hypothetical protein
MEYWLGFRQNWKRWLDDGGMGGETSLRWDRLIEIYITNFNVRVARMLCVTL